MGLKPSMQPIQSELVIHETRFGSAPPVVTLNWLRAGIERMSWNQLLRIFFYWTGWPGVKNIVAPGGQVSSSSNWPPGHTEKICVCVCVCVCVLCVCVWGEGGGYCSDNESAERTSSSEWESRTAVVLLFFLVGPSSFSSLPVCGSQSFCNKCEQDAVTSPARAALRCTFPLEKPRYKVL
jgi:hypothetical protein